jgi:ATP-binding cassette subfamily B (MDR/TAP) protein 1
MHVLMVNRFAANGLAFWQGSRMVSSTGGAGTVYAIVFLILDASFVIGAAGPFIQSFALAASAGARILSLIDYPTPNIDVYSTEGEIMDDKTIANDIVFNHVSFAYPARPDETILRGVNLSLKAGTMIGVVGSSGSGKSTIAALLLRLYDPTDGDISIGSLSLPEYNLASLRSKIALVDQDPAVFSGTIFTNIRQGLKNQASLDESEQRKLCVQAAKDAGAWSFIQLLPQGLDTQIGEPSGTKLSGGQKQRLCIARALVGDPSVLVLDEATSALDTITEVNVLRNLRTSRSSGNRTTIMIAHRLSTVKDADSIIVMGKGQVLEQGSHDVLMAEERGHYRALVEAQQLDSFEKPTPAVDSGVKEQAVTSETEKTEEQELYTEAAPKEVKDIPTVQMSTTSILGRCLGLSKSKALFIMLGLCGSIVTGGLILGESLIFGNLVQILNSTEVSGSRADFFCLMFFIVSIIAFFAYITSGTFFGIVSEHLILRTRDLSLRSILRQDQEWFLKPGRSTSALSSVLNMDSGHLSGLSGVIIGTVFSGLTSVIGGAILAHIVAWKIAIVLFSTAPIVILAGFFRIRVIAQLEEKNQKAYTEAASLATEACTAIRTVAALGAEKSVATGFKSAVSSQRSQTMRGTVMGNLLLAFALAITYFVYALAYWWGSKQVREGHYSTLQFFIVMPAILFSAQAAGQMFSLAPEVGRAKAAAARVFALHDEKPTIEVEEISTSNASSTRTLVGGEKADDGKVKGTIEFRNVSLTYATRPNKPIFTNLSFTIPAGSTYAFVGTSGAGKSSAVSLIERFYDPTEGAVLIDGVDIRDIPVAEHRARLSLVSQDPDLFSGSVEFNVGLGRKPGQAVGREQVEEACKSVGIHEFVEGLSDGYNT